MIEKKRIITKRLLFEANILQKKIYPFQLSRNLNSTSIYIFNEKEKNDAFYY